MKMIVLMILFSTPLDPEPHEGSRYGYGHRTAPSMEVCLKRRDMTLKQLERKAPERTKFTAFCVEMEVQGYSEAVERFKRTIGDVL